MKPRTSPRRLAGALATAGVAFLAATAPAHADSIAYVKGGNVYLTTPDGSRTAQVTKTGGYSSVSQDDQGRMVAVHGNRIAHLDRNGAVLSDILTPVSNPSGMQEFTGPFDAQLSPDGRKVSYTYYWKWITEGPHCQPQYGCYLQRLYHGTGYTDPDALTAWDAPGFRRQTGWIHGSWIDNDTQLLSDPSMKPNEDLVLTSPGLDGEAGFRRWAEHRQAEQMEDGEMTRDRHKMAFITGSANDHVWFYNVRTGFYPDYPSTCETYELKDPAGGRFSDLSWSPDGSRLAYADGDGVATVAIPEFGTGPGDCGTPGEDSKLIVPGASSPDWGPADVPQAAPGSTPATPGTGPGNGPKGNGPKGNGPAPVTPTPPATTPKLRARPGRLAATLRKGLIVRITAARPGPFPVTARSGGKIVARSIASVGANGTARVKLRFDAGTRRRLARRRSIVLRVSGAGASTRVTLRR